MALKESQRKANDKYIAAKYERLPISYSKDFCAAVRAAAEASGCSLAGYIKKAIEAQMERDMKEKEEAQ